MPSPAALAWVSAWLVASIRAVAAIDGRLAGFDHGAVEDLAGGRVDDLSNLAPVAVGMVDAQRDHMRRDAPQVVAALRAPGALCNLGSVDAVQADLDFTAAAGG